MKVQAHDPDSPYAAFWMGGYEGADHINAAGTALDMAASSGHIQRLDEDHRRAAGAGIGAVRESIGWRLAEDSSGRIDLSRAERIAASAERHGLQVLWTLMHYGLPGDLNLHDDALILRFTRFAAEVASVIGRASPCAPVFTPVNEIGFLAWAASQPGLLHAPNNMPDGNPESTRISGYAVKRRLVRAALAAMQAMREIEPRSRFLHVEPVVHVAAPLDQPELAPLAAEVRSWQWQAWDLLAGRAEPALGGAPQWLDLVGVNHYHNSQWEVGTERVLDWSGRDPRRLPLSALLTESWQRYGRPLLVAETSHVGEGRAAWLDEIACEVRQSRAEGVPVHGICLYPLVDRPDWNDTARWHRSGLWHVPQRTPPAGAPNPRHAEPEVLAALRAWQRVLPKAVAIKAPLPSMRPLLPALQPALQPAAPSPAPQAAASLPVLLVFSHLRWEFVRHRARHLMSRLAAPVGRWRVVFVEEPLHDERDLAPWLDRLAQGPHIDVLVPHMPLSPSMSPSMSMAQPLLQSWLAGQGVQRPTVWLCTPMSWPLARALRPRQVVYDVSDELAFFHGAAPELPQREAELLAAADLVFAAGAALAAPRLAAAAGRLKLLSNGVEGAHFAPQRRVPGSWDADEAARILADAGLADMAPGTPCLGYLGVVDERIDLALLQHLADARPQWQFVFIGPVLKIVPALLPRRPNLHWLERQPYRLLPHLMARWQVGLVPFVAMIATARANPLKVTEYLAAGLRVVSTVLPELDRWHSAGVAQAADAAAFLRHCDAALDESEPAAARRSRKSAPDIEGCSWDRVAALAQAALAALPNR